MTADQTIAVTVEAVRVTESPDAPQNLVAAMVDDPRVTLDWTAPDDNTITHYEYRVYRGMDMTDEVRPWKVIPGGAAADRFTVTGLPDNNVGEFYTFQVRSAVNNAAKSTAASITATGIPTFTEVNQRTEMGATRATAAM